MDFLGIIEFKSKHSMIDALSTFPLGYTYRILFNQFNGFMTLSIAYFGDVDKPNKVAEWFDEVVLANE